MIVFIIDKPVDRLNVKYKKVLKQYIEQADKFEYTTIEKGVVTTVTASVAVVEMIDCKVETTIFRRNSNTVLVELAVDNGLFKVTDVIGKHKYSLYGIADIVDRYLDIDTIEVLGGTR